MCCHLPPPGQLLLTWRTSFISNVRPHPLLDDFNSAEVFDGHPGQLCDTDGWVRASFPWVKYQVPVRPVSPLIQHYTMHPYPHKLNTCWDTFAIPMSWNMFFFYIYIYLSCPFECLMDMMTFGKKDREHLYSYMWHLKGSSFLFVSLDAIWLARA